MGHDVAEELANKIRSDVLKSQGTALDGLEGKYVERDGVTFLVVKVDRKKGKVIVSDTKTPVDQVTPFAIKAFLSKAVHQVDRRG